MSRSVQPGASGGAGAGGERDAAEDRPRAVGERQVLARDGGRARRRSR